MEIVFDGPLDGLPLDVELCNPPNAIGNPRLAISFEDPISASADGTVRLYEPLTRVSTELTLIKEVTGKLKWGLGSLVYCYFLLVVTPSPGACTLK